MGAVQQTEVADSERLSMKCLGWAVSTSVVVCKGSLSQDANTCIYRKRT